VIQTPREMLQSALMSIGADGLCNPGCECGCPLDLLAPGGYGCLNLDECKPSKFVPPWSPGADLDILQQSPEGYFVLMELMDRNLKKISEE